MSHLQYLNKIVPYVDDAFSEFYDAMLSDEKMSMFFQDDAQIHNLVKMQKIHFLRTIDMSGNDIEKAYVKLGEYHYDLRIPYVDFIKGSQMLEQYFLVHTTKNEFSSEIMDDIFKYFQLMKSFTAKGYLNRMIQEDKKDIETFFTFSGDYKYIDTITVASKIQWLREVLEAIEKGEELDLVKMELVMDSWITNLSELSEEKKALLMTSRKE